MSDDPGTITAYGRAAQDYADGFAHKNEPDQSQDMAAFLCHVPAGGRILDWGCGPGHWAAAFRDLGYAVDATDATPEMAVLALDRFGITVRTEPFEALDAAQAYDGIWANFSLLHAPRADLPLHLRRIHTALRPGGGLHLGMKLGTGEGRDRLDRFYTYYTEDELIEHVETAGLTVVRPQCRQGRGLAGTVEPFAILTAHA